jgi:hypothetical protein
MQVKCSSNHGSALRDHWFFVGNTPRSEFHVTIGGKYQVFGIAFWRSTLNLLLKDDTALPNWYPLDLFEVTDPSVSPSWKFASFASEGWDLEAVLGYEDLLSPRHYEALLERDEDALRIFANEVTRLETRGEKL